MGDNRQKVAYGPYGNEETRKVLYEMLWQELERAEFGEGRVIPKRAVVQYFLGETRADTLLEEMLQLNAMDDTRAQEEIRRKLYKALRAWISAGREEIERLKMGSYYDAERIKRL